MATICPECSKGLLAEVKPSAIPCSYTNWCGCAFGPLRAQYDDPNISTLHICDGCQSWFDPSDFDTGAPYGDDFDSPNNEQADFDFEAHRPEYCGPCPHNDYCPFADCGSDEYDLGSRCMAAACPDCGQAVCCCSHPLDNSDWGYNGRSGG